MRLDLVLIARHPELSRRKAREVIEKGQVTLAGVTVQEPGKEVSVDAPVSWNVNRPALPRARISLPLLYRDETVIIVDKPAGLLAVPTSEDATDEDTAEARVLDFVKHLNPRRPYVGVVHRLDRDTSGALAFTLAADARAALRVLFREHRIERRYAALVLGEPREDEGVVDLPIADAYEGGRRHVAREEEESRPAHTRWRVVERLAGYALLDIELQTGRQHQIRVHLSHLGLPVVGDSVYARDERRPMVEAPRQMLHARLLNFTHPLTGVAVACESPLPEDFMAVLRRLRAEARQHKGRPSVLVATNAPARPAPRERDEPRGRTGPRGRASRPAPVEGAETSAPAGSGRARRSTGPERSDPPRRRTGAAKPKRGSGPRSPRR